MANNKFIHLLLACTLLATACDDNDAPADESKAYPAIIMAEAFDHGSVTGTTWYNGETIGVYMMKNGTDDIVAPYGNLLYYANQFDNQDYFLPGDDELIPYFPATGEKMDIAAYYPRTTVLADRLVALHLINNYEYASQLLFARATGLSKDNRKAELALFPVLTKLTFKFKVGYGLTKDDLQGLSVTLQGLPLSGNFDATTGKIDFRNVALDEELKLTTAEAAATRAGNDAADNVVITAQGLVFPTSSTEGYKVKIELPAAGGGAGKTYDFEIEKVTNEFEGSQEYTFTTTINNEELIVIVDKSPIAGWEPGGTINGDGEESN